VAPQASAEASGQRAERGAGRDFFSNFQLTSAAPLARRAGPTPKRRLKSGDESIYTVSSSNLGEADSPIPRPEEVPMAIVARFCFDVPFGKKTELMAALKKWQPVSEELGFPKPLLLVGSIGAPESRVEINHTFPSLSALEAVWSKLNDPRMPAYQKDLAPFVVPGSNRWEVFRVQEV
jgi:hypothetical protein